MAGLDKSSRGQTAGAAALAPTSPLPAAAAKIEPAAVVRAARKSYLAGLNTVTRRPPALHLRPTLAAEANGLDALLLPEVKRIAATETAEFAFSVAELALRLEKRVKASSDQGAKDGLAVLSEMARMYEHLFVLQAGHGGV
jgi:hypothetical protein